MIKIPYYETSFFVFSNFSSHAVVYKNILYPTVEHAYHASKFDNEKIRNKILNAKSPLEACDIGKLNKSKRILNWDEIKINILYEIIKEKVNQHTEVREALLSTENNEIIEDNPNDSFWGNGNDGNGENNMGKILMRIRSELF